MDACWVLVKGCSLIVYGWALVVLTGARGTCASPGVGRGFYKALCSVCVAIEMCCGEGSTGISGRAALPSPFTWAWLASWRRRQLP